ncbi:MAG TPA: hypothetical protein PLF42_12340 [Anaerolineales bacterium]|nr:hypothetical protein [Anaerolineales bacterium]
MKHKRNWLIGIALSATAGFLALQSVNAPTQGGETPPADVPCAYVWATRDAPELTEALDARVKSLDPAASATAYFFGEDCVHADGLSTFDAMETDFTIRLPVDHLTDQESFGNWMARVMDIIIALPREEIQGPRTGFVEFQFTKTDSEQVIVRVPIDKYMIAAQGETGADLFQLFHTQP